MNVKSLFRFTLTRLISLEARLVLRKYHPKVVLITGSVGKTSTKDAVYAALAKKFFVRKSEKSYNSDIGVPLTILGVPNAWSNPLKWIKNILEGLMLLILSAPYPKILVIEVGADRPGDISRTLSWLTPDIVIATRFPPISVHVEYYENPREVIAEELAPVGWLTEGGTLIVNGDDVEAEGASPKAGVSKISFGFGADTVVRAVALRTSSEDRAPTGVAFDVSHKGEKVHVSIPDVIGRTHAYAALGGIAAGIALGETLTEAAEAIRAYEPPPGRLRLIEGATGTLIDDSYNASPIATEEALEALSTSPHRGRRIAVLADMLELGAFSVAEHKRIGAGAARSADLLVAVGVRGRGIAEGARGAGMPAEAVHECEKGSDATDYLKSILVPGDVVLIKGSQSMRMEKVVKALMANPDDAKKLLCRQDEEWLQR